MSLRVLIVESEPEDLLFLQEALTEIESGRYWSNWIHIEMLHAVALSGAMSVLNTEKVDVILLDLDLTDSRGMETFRRVEAAFPHIPILVLGSAEYDALSAGMMREGAQDYLRKEQVDCAPLAHALRNAIERHKFVTAARAGAMRR